MKQITIRFEVNDNVPIKSILTDLAISIMLQKYNANTVTIEQPLKNIHATYDLAEYRRELRRFPQATNEGDAL